jgi:hypothetical protein
MGKVIFAIGVFCFLCMAVSPIFARWAMELEEADDLSGENYPDIGKSACGRIWEVED